MTGPPVVNNEPGIRRHTSPGAGTHIPGRMQKFPVPVGFLPGLHENKYIFLASPGTRLTFWENTRTAGNNE
jgi:hypothetical protein